MGVIQGVTGRTHTWMNFCRKLEKRMYEDKAVEYYKKTGIERRGADKKG
ncbi:MAG: hypothetical protein ACLR78_00405 [Roseburia sp.]